MEIVWAFSQASLPPWASMDFSIMETACLSRLEQEIRKEKRTAKIKKEYLGIIYFI